MNFCQCFMSLLSEQIYLFNFCCYVVKNKATPPVLRSVIRELWDIDHVPALTLSYQTSQLLYVRSQVLTCVTQKKRRVSRNFVLSLISIVGKCRSNVMGLFCSLSYCIFIVIWPLHVYCWRICSSAIKDNFYDGRHACRATCSNLNPILIITNRWYWQQFYWHPQMGKMY